MGFSLALLFVCTFIASSSGSAVEIHNPSCPPPEEIYPCTCYGTSGEVTAVCEDIKNEGTIREVFNKNPDWKLNIVHFERCTYDYIPASILETSGFETLRVVNSTMVSLFDAVPVKSPSYVNIDGVRILRGFEWEFFSKANLSRLQIVDTDIPTIGRSFKEHMSTSVTYMWFESTKTSKIKHQAFQRMVNLHTLGLLGGTLKNLSRDMFPRPWNIRHISLSRQKLSELPTDFFADLPKLESFYATHNHFKTLPKETFTMTGVYYQLYDNPFICNCRMKWITNYINDEKTSFHGECSEPESFKERELSGLTPGDFEYCE